MPKNRTRHSPIIILALMLALPLTVWLALSFTIDTVVKHHAEYRGIYWSQLLQTRFPHLENHFQLRSAANEQYLTHDEGMSAAEIGTVTLFRLDGSVSKEYGTRKNNETAGRFELNKEKAATVLASGLHSIHSNINQNSRSNSPKYIDVYVPMVNFKGEPIGIFGIQVDQTVTSGIIYSTFSWLVILLPLLIGAAYLLPSLAFSKRHEEALYAERTVELLSKYDTLTGTQNRASFSKAAEKLFTHKMDKTQRIGVIFIDIDDFKKINAENGHTAGDMFLVHVASSIKKQIRESDLVSRFGGDQFIACLPSVSAAQLNKIAERILRGVEKSVFHQGNLINRKINVGTYLAEGGQSFEDAIYAADAALNNAKECNKNHVVEYTAEMDRELQIRRNLESLLIKAQTGEGLELFYQPIVDPKTHLVVGFEALMRLMDEQGKMISPMEFIPVATELGLIDSMGKWAIDEALATAKCWPAPIFVAVNLSPVQFEKGDLPDTVKSALQKNDVAPDRLELEVTESLLMGDDGKIFDQIRAVKELGIGVSMDDFGTGYSSLSYLWKYEFSKLKIDRSFLLGYDDEPETLKDIIESIVILGHRIGMSVTAEGVETHIHASMLADVGCDSLQGFFFARPMPAWEATQAINLQHLEVTSKKMSAVSAKTELESDRKSA